MPFPVSAEIDCVGPANLVCLVLEDIVSFVSRGGKFDELANALGYAFAGTDEIRPSLLEHRVCRCKWLY